MGLTLIRHDTNIDFVGMRRIAYVVSIAAMLIGLASVAFKGGLSYGIDFAGGAIVQVKFDRPVADATLKQGLSGTDLPGLVVQRFGEGETDYLIRISHTEERADVIRTVVAEALETHIKDATFEIQRLEMVGPKVGEDLKAKAVEALYYSVLLIAIYISGRFEQRWMAAAVMAGALAGGMYVLGMLGVPRVWLVFAALGLTFVLCWKLRLNFALGAIVALVHDVLVTVGVLSLLDKEVDLNIVAALLTLVGYSLNDTIIVYDRIRETLRGHRKEWSYAHIINASINQTLSRTILTGGTTLAVLLVLFVLGGGVIHDFALTMLVGVFVGILSSIFVASPILLAFGEPDEQPEPAPRVGQEGAV
ncbi:protein translocase subunit SecF [Nitratidesulfovibrio sp. D1]|uniref:protein translocase subunit SecF n=1 Tax=Nitratidesulfovibrio sp. D1 TaxID=3440151 RepID=UPI003EB6D516